MRIPFTATPTGPRAPGANFVASFALFGVLGAAPATLGLLGPVPAFAADVTDMPEKMRGDLTIDYDSRFLSGSIEESVRQIDGSLQQWGYGRRNEQEHTLMVRAEFAPLNIMALNIGFEQGLSRVNSFPTEAGWFCPEGYACDGPIEMRYDPVYQRGTYIDSEYMNPDDVPRYAGKGLKGVWFGVAFQPFAERFARNHHVTWRVDIQGRTPNPNGSFWTVNENGTRGAAQGGSAFRLAAAFSTDNGIANPYIQTIYTREGKVTLDYRDENGTVWGTDLQVDPADTLETRAGVELVGVNDPSTGTRFAVDFYTALAYVTPEDIPSGLLLPDVLDQSKAFTVVHSDHVTALVGLGLDFHITKYTAWRMAVDGKYFTPHPLETVYGVRSDYDTFQLGVHGNLDIRFR